MNYTFKVLKVLFNSGICEHGLLMLFSA